MYRDILLLQFYHTHRHFVPAGWRIRTVLGLRALVHVLLGAGGAAVILLLSRKTRSTIQTMLIAAGVLVVPTVAVALLW